MTVEEENEKSKRRRYWLHCSLRRKGNTVIARKRTVIKREKQLTDVETGWLKELLAYGYGWGVKNSLILRNNSPRFF